MFYIEWNGTKFTDIHDLTMKELIELLESLKGAELKWKEE